MENKELTIRQYCKDKKISMEQFHLITGVSASLLYRIQDDRNANLTKESIMKIYYGTKDHFGEGLDYHEYLNKDLGVGRAIEEDTTSEIESSTYTRNNDDDYADHIDKEINALKSK